MALDLEPAVTLPWLVRLRWSFLVGQLVVLPIVHAAFDVVIDVVAVGIEIAILAATNAGLEVLRRRGAPVGAHLIGATLLVDTGLLTLLLVGSGGSANPFTVLYLVHITMSAIVLSARWTAMIAIASLAGFALLFAGAGPPAMHMHGASGFDHHLQAMWAAFALAAALTAFFVGRITRAIASQREQIARLRESNERGGRLASLTRLAAGAAHELGSPLATIAVAAHEAKLSASGTGAGAPLVADLELIAMEVQRCQEILARMAARGERADQLEALTPGDLGDRIRDLLGEDRAQRVDVKVEGARDERRMPAEPLADAVVALVRNALDASAPDDRVVVAMASAPASLVISIQDHGAGMPSDVLAQVGRPFFTTKETGRGLGLGVFIARTFVESHGGTLAIESSPGAGTRATLHLPTEAP